MSKTPITVIIPTRDEELNIELCLRSVSWADQVMVVDSHSKDRTGEIAERFGAELYQFDYTGGWPKKKNWVLEHLPIRNEWVFFLDADERIPGDLQDEIAQVVTGKGTVDGYWVRFRVYFLGRWIKHTSLYPTWILRLFRKEKGRFEKISVAAGSGDVELHENVILDGQQGYLKHDLIHEDLKPLQAFIERHNRYSTWEAEADYQSEATSKTRASLLGTPPERRRWMKRLFVRLPLRPLIKFSWIYLFRLGFLDGISGLIFSFLMAQHEVNISIKRYEKRAMTRRLKLLNQLNHPEEGKLRRSSR